MIVDDFSSISSALEKYRFFQECLLQTARLAHFGTSLDLELGYVWDDKTDSDVVASTPRPVLVRLWGMQETTIVTDLPASVLDDPAQANWGLTEIAMMHVLPQSDLLAKHHDSGRPLYHLAVEWETHRRIDSIFAQLEVVDPAPVLQELERS
jgi:hypothetical protein